MISRNDIERVADGLHAAAIGEEPWQAALTGLSRLVPCELATLEIMDAKSGAYTDFHASRSLDINADYLAYYFQINPRLDGVLNRPELLLMGDYDFLSEEEMGRVYDDFLRPNGLRYCAGVRTVHTRELIGTFSLQRSPRQGHVTEEQLDVLGHLRPHMRRATLTWLRFGQFVAETEFLSSLLTYVEDGIVVIGPSGKVRFLNAAAEAICRQQDGFDVAGGEVTIRSAKAQALLMRAIAHAQDLSPLEPAPDRQAIVARDSGLPPYLVTFVPIPPDRERRFDNARGGVVVWIKDPARPGRPANALLEEAFGLSGAESDVARALAGGLTVRRIAERRGVSVATVRSQIQSILQKTHLHRQADLIRLLTRLDLAL